MGNPDLKAKVTVLEAMQLVANAWKKTQTEGDTTLFQEGWIWKFW